MFPDKDRDFGQYFGEETMQEEKFQIFIKAMNGKTNLYSVSKSYTIKLLKSMIQINDGVEQKF